MSLPRATFVDIFAKNFYHKSLPITPFAKSIRWQNLRQESPPTTFVESLRRWEPLSRVSFGNNLYQESPPRSFTKSLHREQPVSIVSAMKKTLSSLHWEQPLSRESPPWTFTQSLHREPSPSLRWEPLSRVFITLNIDFLPIRLHIVCDIIEYISICIHHSLIFMCWKCSLQKQIAIVSIFHQLIIFNNPYSYNLFYHNFFL